MKYFFWNTNKQKCNKYILDLEIEKKYNIIALAEYEDNKDELLYLLKKNNLPMRIVPSADCRRILLLTNLNLKRLEQLGESPYHTKQLLKFRNGEKHILTFLHLPAQGNTKDIGRTSELGFILREIEELEEKLNTNNTIIVGDFNADPYEDSILSVLGLHSIPSRIDAKRKERQVNYRKYKMFYNPMWNNFGDFNEPPGTYYYDKAGHIQSYWHIFDQVVIRPQLIDLFSNDSLKIVMKSRNFLLYEKNKILVGDHLPIEFEIYDKEMLK